MKNNYPTKYEIYEALMMTSASFVKSFAQRLGLFVTNSRQEDVAKEISRIFLEEEDIELIRSEAYQQKITHSLSGFTVSSSSKDFSLEKNYNWIAKEGQYKAGIILNSLRKEEGEGVYKGSYAYKRKKPGRIELLQDEENSFDFYLKKGTEEGVWNVEIDSTRSTDLKELLELFRPTLRGDETKVEVLDEKFLTTKNSIDFFDVLSKFGQEEKWALVEVTHVSIRKNMDENSEEVGQKDLDGISQAIIEGRNLRENLFVTNAVAAGFSFSAMTYEFENTKDPIGFQIRAEFKGRPKVFEISILKYYKVIGTEKRKVEETLTNKENLSLRSRFWNFSKEKFEGLKNRVK